MTPVRTDPEIETLLADYTATRSRALRLQEELVGLSRTARAPRNAVEVTVNGRGELTALAFPTDAYRTMTSQQLAASVLKTAASARAAVSARTAELMAEFAPGTDAARYTTGSSDWASRLPADPTKLFSSRR